MYSMVVDGSNESLEHADEEYDAFLWKGMPLQKSFEKVDVCTPMLISLHNELKNIFTQSIVVCLQNQLFITSTEYYFYCSIAHWVHQKYKYSTHLRNDTKNTRFCVAVRAVFHAGV